MILVSLGAAFEGEGTRRRGRPSSCSTTLSSISSPNDAQHQIDLLTESNPIQGLEWATPSSLRSDQGKARTVAAIERVHTLEHLDEIRRVCSRGGGAADFDT